MKFITIVLIGFGLLWWLIFSAQASRTVGIKLQVPKWLAKLSGSKNQYIDPGLFSLQVFCLFAILWAIPSGLLSNNHSPGDIFGMGLLAFIPVTGVLFLSLVYLAKKKGNS
jgi:hypothetical protein